MSEEKIYTISVTSNGPVSASASADFNGYNAPINSNLLSDTTFIDNSIYHWGYPWYSGVTYSWPTTIYMYELKCPRCKTRNWGQINAVVACKKCTAKLKAVSQEVDFEIPVGV